MTSWIKIIPPSEATGKLAGAYESTKTPQGRIDNVMKAHSLLPHTMEGHAALYKAVLHHPDNGLPKWFLEVIGTYTSILNNCDYSVAHHAKNTLALLGDEEKGSQVLAALHGARIQPNGAGGRRLFSFGLPVAQPHPTW